MISRNRPPTATTQYRTGEWYRNHDANEKHASTRAILVLEPPWGLYKGDANQTSVLPFLQGVARMDGDTEVFYANFYDTRRFEHALECLCKMKFENTTVYVAGHGDTDEVAGVETPDILFAIGEISQKYNIAGFMLGACLAGGATDDLTSSTQETNIKWCAGYSTSVYWLEGTMIDCTILSLMSKLTQEDFASEAQLIENFGEAIAPFSATYAVGKNSKNRLTRYADSMEFIVRPAMQGCRPKVVTKQVFNAGRAAQLPSGEPLVA